MARMVGKSTVPPFVIATMRSCPFSSFHNYHSLHSQLLFLLRMHILVNDEFLHPTFSRSFRLVGTCKLFEQNQLISLRSTTISTVGSCTKDERQWPQYSPSFPTPNTRLSTPRRNSGEEACRDRTSTPGPINVQAILALNISCILL